MMATMNMDYNVDRLENARKLFSRLAGIPLKVHFKNANFQHPPRPANVTTSLGASAILPFDNSSPRQPL